MKYNYLLLISFSVLLSLSICRDTTKSEEFIRNFNAKHITDGDGETFPNDGDSVTVHYVGSFPLTGEVFDSSINRNETFVFPLGQGHVIPCWDQVLTHMSKGEKVYVVCPSKLAYGEAGAGGIIPPNTDIAFEIELISIERGPEQVTTSQEEGEPEVHHEDL